MDMANTGKFLVAEKQIIKPKKPLAVYLWFIYAFIALRMMRFYITDSSFISLGQLSIIILTFFCLVYNNKFHIYKTKDDFLVLSFVFFLAFNCLIQNMFRLDATFKLIQLQSLAVSLLIIFPYFVSRCIELDQVDKGRFIRYLFLGMSLLIIYMTCNSIAKYLETGNTSFGRITVAQRYPVVINFVFLIALLFKTKSLPMKMFAFSIAVLSLLLMVVSLTRGAYVSMVVDLVILILMRPKKIFRFTAILIALFLGVSLMSGKMMGPFRVAKKRFAYTIETFKDPTIDASASIRITIWKNIFKINSANPLTFLFGSGELGIGQLERSDERYRHELLMGSAHSQYFDTFARSGLIGLMLFLFINYRMIKLSFLLRYDKQYGWFYTAVGIGYLSMLAYNLFEESFRFMTFGIFFYAIYGMLVSEFSLVRNRQLSKLSALREF